MLSTEIAIGNMRQWTTDVIEQSDLNKTGFADRRQVLKWAAAGGTMGLAGLAGCSEQSNEGSTGTSEESTSGSSSGGSGAPSGSITFQLPADARNLDPAMWQNTEDAVVVGNLYDKLLMFDENMELTPQLAAEMPAVSDDLLTYEFTLKEGVFFHGGEEELTADDVVYSMEYMSNPPEGGTVNAAGFYTPWIDSTEKTGEYQVQMNLKEPFGLLPIWLTRAGDIVREGTHGEFGGGSAASETGAVTELSDGPQLEQAAGTGPFYLDEWQRGDFIRLRAHEDYWMENAPGLEEVTFEVIPESSTALSALRSGAADVLWTVPFRNFEELQSQPEIETGSRSGLKAEVIYFDNQFGFEDSPDDPETWEHLRKAVAFGIDRRRVVRETFRGQAKPSWAPWVEGLGGEGTVAPELRYENLDWVNDSEQREANVMRHLEEGGRPDGFSFDAVATSASWFVNMAQIMAADLEQYGIEMNVIPTEKAQMGSYYYAGMSSAYDAAVEDFDNAFPAPEFWLLEGYYDVPNHLKWRNADQIEEAAPRTGNDTNTPWYDEFGEFLFNAMEAPDEETRKQNIWEAQRMAIDHMGQVNVCFVNINKAWRSSVDGYQPSQIGYWDDLRTTTTE